MDLEGIEKDKKSGIQKIKSHAAHKLQEVTNKTSDLLKIPPSPLPQRSLNLATSLATCQVLTFGLVGTILSKQ